MTWIFQESSHLPENTQKSHGLCPNVFKGIGNRCNRRGFPRTILFSGEKFYHQFIWAGSHVFGAPALPPYYRKTHASPQPLHFVGSILCEAQQN